MRASFSALAGKLSNKKRSVRLADAVELLVGAESNVFRRCVASEDGDASLCLSILTVDGAGSADGARESLDIRCTDELQFARVVAALHALIAHAGGGAAQREVQRAQALARAAPQLHHDMMQREAALEAELRAKAEEVPSQIPQSHRLSRHRLSGPIHWLSKRRSSQNASRSERQPHHCHHPARARLEAPPWGT